MLNISDVIRLSARRYPERPCVSFRDRTHTYAEFADIVGGAAADLLDLGVRPGTAVVTLAANSDVLLATYLAIGAVGGVNVPANTMSTAADLQEVVERSGATLVLHDPEHRALAADVQSGAEELRLVELRGEPGDDLADLRRCAIPDLDVSGGDAVGMVLFTSGSTGRPKGCVKSHRNLLFHALHSQLATPRTSDECELHIIPLAGIGVCNFALVPLLAGGQVVLERFDPARVVELLATPRITRMFLPPTMIHAVLGAAPAGSDLKGRVHRIDTGFEMSARLRQRAVEAFGPVFCYGYGSSEGTMSYADAEDFLDDPQCVGRVFGLDEVAIMGPDGRLLAEGEVGEIVTRGPTVLAGYLADDELNRESIRDGWFHTGDLGVLQAGRRLYFAGRIKDMIKTGGVNVAAAEVEEAVGQHPAVESVAVVGVPDERWGEAVVAAVVIASGAELSEAELAEHAAEHLAGFKRPKHWVILDALPLNANGKVAKGTLAEEIARRLELATAS